MLNRYAAPVAGVLLTVLACGGAEELTGVPDRTVASPTGWFGGSSVANNFLVGFDRGIKHSGGAAGFIESASVTVEGFGSLAQQIKADRYRGQRVRWSAWVRQRDLAGFGAGLWMRIDGPGIVQGFDNMLDRPLIGTAGWHEVSIVLDVPTNAIGIIMGALVSGPGELVVDDFKFETVGKDIGLTRPVSASPLGADSATAVATYARANLSPVNLDFESNSASASRFGDHGVLAGGASTSTGKVTVLSCTVTMRMVCPGLCAYSGAPRHDVALVATLESANTRVETGNCAPRTDESDETNFIGA